MSILNIDKLLAPVTQEAPSGEDLSDLTEYYVLEELAKGREETQFSGAEPPDWHQVEKLAQELLLQGKEMWVISHLICAMTANHGINGLNEGIAFLSRVLPAFWETIFPEPDVDDPFPHEQRLNVLASLSDSTSSLMGNIRQMPLCKSRQLGEFSYRDILLSRGELKSPEGESAPEKNLIEAAVRDTDPEFMAGLTGLIKETQGLLHEIEAFLNDQVGSQNNTANILKIETELKSILAFIEPASGPQHQEETGDDDNGETGAEDQNMPAPGTAKPSATGAQGALNSRDNVYALLNEIIEWYAQNEPASPVAMIIERAKDLVGKNFFQIMSGIMGPEVPQVQTLFGPPEEHQIPDNTPAIQQVNFNINSRHDILNWLNQASMWYYTNEPSSPVPLFIHRAKQLVGKNFQQIISEIADQAQDQVADLINNK